MRGREAAEENAGGEKGDFFDCERVKVDHEAGVRETRCCRLVEVRKTGWKLDC